MKINDSIAYLKQTNFKWVFGILHTWREWNEKKLLNFSSSKNISCSKSLDAFVRTITAWNSISFCCLKIIMTSLRDRITSILGVKKTECSSNEKKNKKNIKIRSKINLHFFLSFLLTIKSSKIDNLQKPQKCLATQKTEKEKTRKDIILCNISNGNQYTKEWWALNLLHLSKGSV